MDIAIDDWHFFGIVFVSVAIGALLGIRVAGKNRLLILSRAHEIEFSLTVLKINFIVTGNYRR
ncbi:hypothetical protein A8L48_13770 [Rhizobium rhizogenes]|nr:hypothetical protein A8L48_13770 [Rhizobium rhizogenes]